MQNKNAQQIQTLVAQVNALSDDEYNAFLKQINLQVVLQHWEPLSAIYYDKGDALHVGRNLQTQLSKQDVGNYCTTLLADLSNDNFVFDDSVNFITK